MHFGKNPGREAFRFIFDEKMNRIPKGTIIDLVAVDGELLIGECEIVKIDPDTGAVGIVVSTNKLRQGVGSSLLLESIEASLKIGIKRLFAEVHEGNKPAMGFFLKSGFSLSRSSTTKPGILLERILHS